MIGLSDRRKHKLYSNRIKAYLLQELISIRSNSNGKVMMTTYDGNVIITRLDKNNPSEENCNFLWNQLQQCSVYNEDWNTILS